jgi:hypothetical protein
LFPALEVVGGALTVIVTEETEGGQEPLVIVQRSTLIPTLNPVTVELGALTEVIVPPPDTTVHEPVPTVGVFAASVVVAAQIV